MKKNYSLTFLFFLLLSTLVASNDLVESFTLYDLTHDRMNLSYVDSQGNNVSVSTNEPSSSSFNYLSDIDNPLTCAGESASGLDSPINEKYTKIVIKGIDNTTSPVNSPYFIIDLGEKTTVKEIKFLGHGGASNPQGGSEFLYAFSDTGTAESDFYLPESDDPWDETGWLYFNNQVCNYNNVKITIPEGTRYVKCISTYTYFHWTISLSTSTVIHAIRFFAEPKTSTDILSPLETAYEVKNFEGVLRANELSTISVYDLSGVLVRQASQISTLSLQDLPSGIYIVKSVSELRGQFCVKKISLIN